MLNMTREEAASRMVTNAVNDLRDLERHAERTFENCAKAQEEMNEAGVTMEFQMLDWVAAGYVQYRAKRNNAD